jgi:hypothetical protein
MAFMVSSSSLTVSEVAVNCLQWLIFAAIFALCRRLLLRRRPRLKEVRATANRFRLQAGDEIGGQHR